MKIPQPFHTLSAALMALILVGAALSLGALALLSARAPSVAAHVPVFPQVVALDPTLLGAKAAIIYDPSDGRVLFAKNADESLPLASLTKLMTAEVVLQNTSPQTVVNITPADLTPGGDWDGGLHVGDNVTIQNLLTIGLIASSNDAMTAAISSVPDYLEKMNTTAQAMGLSQTRFSNPTGLDLDAHTSGAYGSAYDVARLAATFFSRYPKYFELTQQSSISVLSGDQTVSSAATAAPLLATPGFLAAKTGYTDLAGGNLVAVFDVEIGYPLVAVVLGSTEEGRFADTLALINAARHADQ